MNLKTLIARIPGVKPAYSLLTQRRRAAAERRALGPIDEIPVEQSMIDEVKMLFANNRHSRKPVVDPSGELVLSTTTHGVRLKTVHLAIESVARGTRLPRRMILWLDDPAAARRLPRTLKRLQDRGLEIVQVPPGWKVHTKYFGFAKSGTDDGSALATCDDDIIYPPTWLENLEARHREYPDSIVCYRAHVVGLTDDGIAQYQTWRACESAAPSLLHLSTSVSGQVLPAVLLDVARQAGEAFRSVAPNNDDVWLHHLAVSADIRTVQVTEDPMLFPFVPGSQATGLHLSNVWNNENDTQINATYSTSDVEKMRAELGQLSS